VRLRDDSSIDLDAFEIPEFKEYEFVAYEELFQRVTYFKRRVYKRVIDYFKEQGLI
jgi:putative (di)nucleoside polyphosphate hydrolase